VIWRVKMPNIYNLFISHSWSYFDTYDRLVKLLENDSYFSYQNFSVSRGSPIHTSGTDAELYQAILNKMKPCHIVIVLAGVYASYSKWINKEIRIAQKEFFSPKPILGIKPRAQLRVSQVVQDKSDDLVGWSTDSIVSAIRRLSI